MKKGLSEVVTIILLITLVFVAIAVLWNIFMYYSENTKNTETGILRGLINETGGSCEPNWQCSQWSSCELAYSMDFLASESFLLSGKRSRLCEDAGKCTPSKIEEEICQTKKEIEVKKVMIEGQEYIEVYDKEENLLIAKLKQSEIDNLKKLDIEFVV